MYPNSYEYGKYMQSFSELAQARAWLVFYIHPWFKTCCEVYFAETSADETIVTQTLSSGKLDNGYYLWRVDISLFYVCELFWQSLFV